MSSFSYQTIKLVIYRFHAVTRVIANTIALDVTYTYHPINREYYAIGLKDIICLCDKGRFNVTGSASSAGVDITCPIHTRPEDSRNTVPVRPGDHRYAIYTRAGATPTGPTIQWRFRSQEASARWAEEKTRHPQRPTDTN